MQENNKATSGVQFLEVEEGYSGQRIDNFLFNRLKNVPKNRFYMPEDRMPRFVNGSTS